jgi:hypothetical protein
MAIRVAIKQKIIEKFVIFNEEMLNNLHLAAGFY